MYTNSPRRGAHSSAHLSVFLLLFLACSYCSALPIVMFDFDAGTGGFENLPALVVERLSASPWSDSDGTLTDFAGNPGRAIAARNWHDGNSLGFTLEVLPGFSLALDGFGFDQRASGSGPSQWSLHILNEVIASGLTTARFVSYAGSTTLDDLAGMLQVVLTASGATSPSGTWRIDNFLLEGAVHALVPEPQSWLLVFGGFATLLLWRSRPQQLSGSAVGEFGV